MFITIPRILSQPDHGSTVYQVCNAIALAYLASTTYWPRAAVAHVRAYGSALTAVNSALEDHQRRSNDGTLLAVWLFVVYEVNEAI